MLSMHSPTMLVRDGPWFGPGPHYLGSNSRSGSRARSFARVNPFFDFSQIPSNIPAGQRDTAWEITPLFHVVNCALSQRDHRMQFLTVDECFALWFGLHGVAFLRNCQMLDNAFEGQN
jgi:hypothetical protein